MNGSDGELPRPAIAMDFGFFDLCCWGGEEGIDKFWWNDAGRASASVSPSSRSVFAVAAELGIEDAQPLDMGVRRISNTITEMRE